MADEPLGVFEDFGAFGFKKGEESKQEANDKVAKLMERAFTERNEFLNDLSAGGGPVLKAVLDNLASRVEQLIDQDPECQAYKKVLGTMNEKLQFGSKIAKRLARLFDIETAPKK